MPKLSNKNIGLCGATLLIIFDVWMIWGSLKLRGVNFFNQILDNMLPCGLLLGAFAFCVLLKKVATRKLGIASMVVFGIAAITRLVVGIMYISDQIKFVNATNTSFVDILKEEGIYLIEFFAFMLLVFSAIFLVIYALYSKFKKTTQVIAGISIIALAGVCVYNIYQLFSTGMYNDQSMMEIYFDILKKGYIWDIVLIMGYALVFGSLTDAMESKKE